MRIAGAVCGTAIVLLAGCGPAESNLDMRQWTDDMAFRISSDPVPPYAREKTQYKVVVRDKKSGQPIEGGEGQIFASNAGGAQKWDVLLPGPERGTYYGTLNFVTSGDWAIAIRFRRDSTKKLERMDWHQDVRPERPTQ